MYESQINEKDRKSSIIEFANKAVRVPRTFVFDQHIPEQEYHLYINPEEYYNEEFDACRDEFQNYRTATAQKKHTKTLTNFNKPHVKNVRLCTTTQNSQRKGQGFLLKSIETPLIREEISRQKMVGSRKKSEVIEKSQKVHEGLDSLNRSFEKSEKAYQIKGLMDGFSIVESSKTMQEPLKSKEAFANCKWNRKEMEISREIREDDKTQMLIEKTKRAIRRNEAECAKLKRRVNDGAFF